MKYKSWLSLKIFLPQLLLIFDHIITKISYFYQQSSENHKITFDTFFFRQNETVLKKIDISLVTNWILLYNFASNSQRNLKILKNFPLDFHNKVYFLYTKLDFFFHLAKFSDVYVSRSTNKAIELLILSMNTNGQKWSSTWVTIPRPKQRFKVYDKRKWRLQVIWCRSRGHH